MFGSGSACSECDSVASLTASQEDLVDRAHCIVTVTGRAVEEEGEAEAFSTPPPLTQQDPQGRQGQSQRGQAGVGEEDGIAAMCSVPFTQTQPSAPASARSSSSGRRPRKLPKPRAFTRRGRGGGAKIRTPSPSPPPSPPPAATATATPTATATTTPPPPPATTATATATATPPPPPTATPSPPATAIQPPTATPPPPPSPNPELDPLFRIVRMIPTAPPATGDQNIFELALSHGIFDGFPNEN